MPIVAYGSSAVATTLGDDGLVWDTPNPALLAESMADLLHRREIRETLVRQQRRRFDDHFSAEMIGRAFDQAVMPLLSD